MGIQVERVILSTITERGLDIASTSFAFSEDQKNKIFQVSKHFGDIDESFNQAYQYYSVPGSFLSLARITNAGKDIVGRTRNKHFVCLLIKKSDFVGARVNPFSILRDDGLFLSDKEIRVLIDREIQTISSVNLDLEKYVTEQISLDPGLDTQKAAYIIDMVFQKKTLVFLLPEQSDFNDTNIPLLFDLLPNQHKEVTSFSTFSYSGQGNFKVLATNEEIYRKNHNNFGTHILVDLSKTTQTYPAAGLFSTFLIHSAGENDQEALKNSFDTVNTLSINSFLSHNDLNNITKFLKDLSEIKEGADKAQIYESLASILSTAIKSDKLLPLVEERTEIIDVLSELIVQRYSREMFGDQTQEAWERAFIRLVNMNDPARRKLLETALYKMIIQAEQNIDQLLIVFNRLFHMADVVGKEKLYSFFSKILPDKQIPDHAMYEFYRICLSVGQEFPNQSIVDEIYNKLESITRRLNSSDFIIPFILETFRLQMSPKGFQLLNELVQDKNEQVSILEKTLEYPEVKANADIRGKINNFLFDYFLEQEAYEEACNVFHNLGGIGLISYLLSPRISNDTLKNNMLEFLAHYPTIANIPQNEYTNFLKNVSRQNLQAGDYVLLVEYVFSHFPQCIASFIEFFAKYLSERGGWAKYSSSLQVIDEKIAYQGNPHVIKTWDNFKRITGLPSTSRLQPRSGYNRPQTPSSNARIQRVNTPVSRDRFQRKDSPTSRERYYQVESSTLKDQSKSSDYLYMLIIFFCLFIGGFFLYDTVIKPWIIRETVLLVGFNKGDALEFSSNLDGVTTIKIDEKETEIKLAPGSYTVTYKPRNNDEQGVLTEIIIVYDDVENKIIHENNKLFNEATILLSSGGEEDGSEELDDSTIVEEGSEIKTDQEQKDQTSAMKTQSSIEPEFESSTQTDSTESAESSAKLPVDEDANKALEAELHGHFELMKTAVDNENSTLTEQSINDMFGKVRNTLKNQNNSDAALSNYIDELKSLWLAYHSSVNNDSFEPLQTKGQVFERIQNEHLNTYEATVDPELFAKIHNKICDFVVNKLKRDLEALGTTLDFRGFYENIESFKLYNIDQLAYLKAEAHEVSLQFKLLFSGKISISPMSVVFEDSSNGTTIENLPAKHDGLFSAEAETNSGKSIVSCLIHHNSDRWLKNSNQIEIRPLKDNRKKIFVNLKIEVCVLPIVSDKPENEYIAWIRMGSQTDDGQKESRKSTKSNVLFYDAENGTQIADKSSSKNSEESNIIIQHKYVIGVTTSPRVVYEDKTIVISSAIDWLQYRENENTISLNEGEYEPTPNRNLTKIDLHLTIERKDLQ